MKEGNTIFFNTRPKVRSYAAVCGSKEREGVIGSYADITLSDDMYGESTYEKAECKMLSDSIALAIKKSALSDAEVDVLLSGDLLNQIISASFAAFLSAAILAFSSAFILARRSFSACFSCFIRTASICFSSSVL